MKNHCQIEHVSQMAYKPSVSNRFRFKIIVILNNLISLLEKGLIKSLKNIVLLLQENKNNTYSDPKDNRFEPLGLKKGDLVRVKSKKDIIKTLDESHRLNGCAFMDEMSQFCETEQAVYKKVEYFFDERLCKFFKAKDIVLLDGLKCSGKLSSFGPRCDRSCYYFWKEAWLEKL